MIDKDKWTSVEKNLWQSTEDPKRFLVSLYYGRDANGKMKKSSKVIRGTLTEARNFLKQHEVDRLNEAINKPVKITLRDVIEDWNRNVGDINTELTTQTSNRNLQRHMIEYLGEMRLNKITATVVEEYMVYLKNDKGLSNLLQILNSGDG